MKLPNTYTRDDWLDFSRIFCNLAFGVTVLVCLAGACLATAERLYDDLTYRSVAEECVRALK